MADARTMSELLQAPTEGYGDAIVIPAILADNFELKVGMYLLLSTGMTGSVRIWLKKEPPRSILTWEDLQRFDESFGEAWDRFKDLLRKCPHYGFSEFHQIDTFYNPLTQSDQDSLNAAAGGNPLNRTPRDALTITKNKSKRQNPSGSGSLPSDTVANPIEECLALADLGASINLMPLSVWKKLSLPKHTPTRMTLELTNRSVTYPVGVTEDVFVKVGKFYFLADFVLVDYDVDPRVPLILERPFLRTARALIDVYGEELTLRVNDEAITFNVRHTSRYSYRYDDELVNRIDFIDVTCEEYAQEVFGFSDSYKSGNPTSSSGPIITTSSPSLTPFEVGEFILEEIEACLTRDLIPSGTNDVGFDPKEYILLFEKLLNDDPSSPLPPKEIHF
nr:reverse transcriptase domain-containing protein [Tanacetum cinerariifolium]